MPIFGIDVSHHQGGQLDWAKIRGAGIDFMFARASLATTPDEHFHTNVNRAKDAGIPVLGAYHFLYPKKVVSPVDQADLFLEQVKVPKGKLMMLDVERDSHQKPRIDDVRAFAERFAKGTGGHPLLMYAPGWYWDIIGNPAASDIGRLVASRYVRVDRKKVGKRRIRIRMTPADAFMRVPKGWWTADHGGWERATILQFTSSGKVPGHAGAVDFNAFRGTVAQLAALSGKAAGGVVAPPIPVVDDKDPPDGQPAEFHTVVAGDTLIRIADEFGWEREGNVPAFRVMLKAFPENEPFRAHPELIRVGDRVRVG